MKVFRTKPVAKITARLTDSDNTVVVPGIASGDRDVDEVSGAINALYGLVGKSIDADSMTRTRTEEVGE